MRRPQPIDQSLDRFCGRVLSEIESVTPDPEKTNHERYLAIWECITERNDELAVAFNDPRRSNALMKLGMILALGVLTEDELASFGPETQEYLERTNPDHSDGA